MVQIIKRIFSLRKFTYFSIYFIAICISGLVLNSYGTQKQKSFFSFYKEIGATLSVDQPVICEGATATITLEGNGGEAPYVFTYEIDGVTQPNIESDNGNSATLTLTDNPPGNFTYTLTEVKDSSSTNETQAITNQEITIVVHTPPTLDLTFNNNNVCSGETIEFISTETGNGPYTYEWGFGDGNTATIKNPSHVYNILGCGVRNLDVTLTVTDSNGCSVTKTKEIEIKEKPDLRFRDEDTRSEVFSNCDNVSPSNPNYEVSVEEVFTSNCADNFSIDWGDGSSSDAATFPAKHTYTAIGVYTMTISATSSSNGCINEVSYEVLNVNSPAVGFSTPGNTNNLCVGEDSELTFIVERYEQNASVTTYTIDWGDGTENEVFTQADIEANNEITHKYEKGSCEEPNGEFTAILTAESGGCNGSTIKISSISILELSKPSFEAESNSCINKSVFFKNTSIIGFESDECRINADVTWDFGDGTVTSLPSETSVNDIEHTYTQPGIYTVSLSIESKCGVAISELHTICIEPEVTAEFSLDTEEGCIPFNVAITNATDINNACSTPTYSWTVEYTAGNCANSEDWEFTKGTDATSENPEILFRTPGSYKLIQAVKTNCEIKTTSKVVEVKKPPSVSISPLQDFCGVATINPTGTIENCTSNTANLSYRWTFPGGNPSSSSSLNPGDIVYNTPGEYKITLEVTNECGISNKATQNFEVFEKPAITNTETTQTICSGQNTSAIELNASNLSSTFSWTAVSSGNITGFTTSGNTSLIPSQTLVNSGNNPETLTYTVLPTLGNCNGDPIDFIITVNPSPFISTQPTSSEICLNGNATPLEVTYTNGNGTPEYQWFENSVNSNVGGDSIPNATNATYNPPTNIVGEIFYYVEISFNSEVCDTIVSEVANVDVVDQITLDPVAETQTLCVGGFANELEVTFTGGSGTPSYQWYKNTVNSNTGGTEVGITSSNTYTPPAFTDIGNFFFYVTISLAGDGCSSVTSEVFEVNVLPDPIIKTQEIASQELCQGATPIEFSVTASGGTTSALNYQWYVNTNNANTGGTLIDGANTNRYTANTNRDGTLYYYAVISQPESGCAVASDVATITVYKAPIFTRQPASSEVCLNDNATSLEVTYTNGTGTPIYQWFRNLVNSNVGGALIPDATNTTYNPSTSAVGTLFYYVEITFNAEVCESIVSEVASVVVHQIPVIDSDKITIYSSVPFSFDPNAILSNIVPNDTKYSWPAPTFSPANGILGASATIIPQDLISQTLENTTTSTIVVTYTIIPATSKCVGDPFILEVTVNPDINSNALVTNNSCFEANNGEITTNIEGGIPFTTGTPYLISWSGPNGFSSTNASITNLAAGTYSLRIEDSTGFFITEEWNVNQPDLLTVSRDLVQNISCFQGNDGMIAITTSGGTEPYTYNWTTTDGGGIVAGASNQNTLTAGKYSLEIIDANNCSTIETFELTEPEILNIETTFTQDVLCFGASTGSIAVTVSGGTPIEVTPGVFDYRYSWSGTNGFSSTSKNIDAIPAGTYTLIVTDNLGCTADTEITINQPPEIIITFTKTDVSCYGETDGAVEVMVAGGAVPYEISWSNFANGFSQSNLSAGTYIATITDGNNCVKKISIDIEQPLFFIDPEVQPISCNDENDGAIKLNLTGGIAPITVSWEDDPSAGVQRNNLSSGTYKVTIIDSNPKQCPIEQTFVLTNPPEIAVSTTVTDAIDCEVVASGSIDLTVSGGSEPYEFNWSNGATSEDLNNISQGDYSVVIKDANGCSVHREFSILRQDPIEIDFIETLITDCDTKTVTKQIEAKVSGGFLPYRLSWSNGTISGVNNEILTTTEEGTFELTVTDNKGCIVTKSVVVNDISSIGDVDFLYESFALTNYSVLSIEDPIQFTNLSTGDISTVTWDFGDGNSLVKEENPMYTYNTIGNYTIKLTVEYDAGCIYTIEKTITISLGWQLVLPTGFTPNGDGYNETIRPKFTGFSSVEMNIYDSWGTLIYFEKGVTLKGWDGNLKSKPAENGNYIMVVIGTTFYDSIIQKTSPVTLLK